nr:MAG TPA: hypothetical protein [Caudoviricetes sp.]
MRSYLQFWGSYLMKLVLIVLNVSILQAYI